MTKQSTLNNLTVTALTLDTEVDISSTVHQAHAEVTDAFGKPKQTFDTYSSVIDSNKHDIWTKGFEVQLFYQKQRNLYVKRRFVVYTIIFGVIIKSATYKLSGDNSNHLTTQPNNYQNCKHNYQVKEIKVF